MKTKIAPQSRQQGSVLLLVLVVAGLIGFGLASYLTLVSSANRSVARSQTWNAAIPLIEAGIEEALAHLNRNCFTNPINGGNVNWTADGWQSVSGGVRKHRALGEGYFTVTIFNSDPENPEIVSEGYVPAPLAHFYNPFLASAGTPQDSQHISRRVRATTTLVPMFNVAMFARGQIDLRGNRIRTDSFDSLDPNYNTNGRYDPAKNKDNGDVATNSGVIDSIDIGNAKIMGSVGTGPDGTVAIGPNGSVGDKAWVEGGNNGIQPGRITDDVNVDVPEVQRPFLAAPPPTGMTLGGINYDYVLFSGNYEMTGGTFKGNILVLGHARLLIGRNAEISLTGNDKITIANNASLQLYVNSPTARLAGNGVINDTGQAINFQYYGMPTNTRVDFGGNASYTGLIYAPNAEFNLGGGGNDNYDFVGASITASVRMNGHFNFHYDEALQNIGPSRGFIITSWNEE